MEAVNLIEKYSTQPELREECLSWVKEHNLSDSGLFDLKKGNSILFKNGFGVLMIAEVLAFSQDGEEAYLHWDCYWFPVKLRERFIQKI